MEPSLKEEPPAKLEVLDTIYVDDSVRAELEPGARVISTAGHGASYWTQTARLDTATTDGRLRTYFLKMARNELGRRMMLGEFESATIIVKSLADFVPRPIAHGTFRSDPTTHFYLCEFHDMTDELPDVEKFCAKVAQLHLNSILLSPKGQFGFHVTTYVGKLPQENRWCDTWEEYFTRGFKHMIATEESVQGPSEEILELSKAMFEKVIPRLLRPLESNGRHIKPCIIHGDLWSGNATMDADSDEPMIFDACAFWGHNEYDPAQWRIVRTKFGRHHIREYHKHFPISEPAADWDDRCALYSIRYNLHSSSLYPSRQKRMRQLVIDEMKRLVEKYPNGLLEQ